jgi:hypothetical protein
MLVLFGSSVLLLPSLAAWDSKKKQKNHKKTPSGELKKKSLIPFYFLVFS